MDSYINIIFLKINKQILIFLTYIYIKYKLPKIYILF